MIAIDVEAYDTEGKYLENEQLDVQDVKATELILDEHRLVIKLTIDGDRQYYAFPDPRFDTDVNNTILLNRYESWRETTGIEV